MILPDGLWPFLRPYRARVAAVSFYAAAGTALELGLELMVQPLVDQGILKGDFAFFLKILVLQLACYVASIALNVLHVRAYMTLSADVAERLRVSLFDKAQRLPLSHYTASNSAALPARLLNEAGTIAAVLGQTLGSLGVSVLQLAGATVLLVYLEWRLAAPVLILLPLNAWFARRAGAVNAALERDYNDQYESVLRFLSQRFSFAAGLLFADGGTRGRAAARFRGLAREMWRTGYRISVIPHWFSLAAYAASVLSTLVVYALGGYLIILGKMTLGTLLSFLAIKSFLERPLGAIANTHIGLQEARVHWDRIREILDAPEEDPGGPEAFEPGDLELRGVRFVRDGRPVLDGADAVIPARKLVALVGPTGAGKSTLTYLIQKHLHPSSGAIRSAGRDLAKTSTESLRGRVAYMGQEAVLLTGTIRENLMLHRPDAAPADVEEACRQAGLAGLLARLPAGLETAVADAGASLSGGERQRISLARALLKRPDLLILDEPTSALDEATELELCRTLRDLVDRTGLSVLAVSHRRALVDAADAVFRVDSGKVTAV